VQIDAGLYLFILHFFEAEEGIIQGLSTPPIVPTFEKFNGFK